MALQNANDIMDLLGSSFGESGLVLDETQLGPDFFDLRTGIAGELFQKFTNYKKKLALVVPDRSRFGERLQELAGEHDRHPLIRFVPDREAGARWLAE